MIDLSRPTLKLDLDAEIARLEGLLADLRRLRLAGHLNAADLATAPLMINPTLVLVSAPAFAGLVIGHPKHGTKGVRTSVVEILGSGWFRSSNRLYRTERIEGPVQ